MIQKHHLVFQSNVHRQKEAEHDNNENTLPNIIGFWGEKAIEQSSSKDNFFDYEIWSFVVSTKGGERGQTGTGIYVSPENPY